MSELEKICALLTSGNAELQCAAAAVLGEIRSKSAPVVKSLLGALKSTNDSVRIYALDALAKMNVAESIPQVIPLLAGSPQVKNRATSLLVSLGEGASKALREKLPKADPILRKGILDVLGQFKGADTLDALFDALLDSDLGVATQATAAIRGRIEGMSPAERSSLAKKVQRFLGSPRVKKGQTPVISGLKILGSLRESSLVKAILPYLDRKQPSTVRSQALQALGGLDLSNMDGRALVSKLLPLLKEQALAEIVHPALQVLSKVRMGKESTEAMLALMRSPQEAARLFAIKALGQIGGSRAGTVLIEALSGDDSRVQEVAGGALRSNAAFAPLLLRGLERIKDLSKAWRLANIVRTYREALDKATLRKFAARCVDLVEKKEGGFQIFFEVVRSAAPAFLREVLLREGRKLLNRKKVVEAERYLRLLDRDDLSTSESDYALALAQLKLMRKDLATAGRDRSRALDLFSRLVRRGDFPLRQKLSKEGRVLSAQDLLYLGFHFTERQGIERDFGTDVLKQVAKRYGKKEEGAVARQKLKTQGVL